MGAIRQYSPASVSTNSQTVFQSNWTNKFAFATQVGNTLVCMFSYSNDNGKVLTLTCTDPKGNNWIQGADVADTTGSGDQRFTWFYCVNASFALANTDNVTVSNGFTDYMELQLWEVTGVTAYITSVGLWQTAISGTGFGGPGTATLNCGPMAVSGSVFCIMTVMNSLDNDTVGPWVPSVSGGLTPGDSWWCDAIAPINGAPLGFWGSGNFTPSSTLTLTGTPSARANADNFVNMGIAFRNVAGASAYNLETIEVY